MATKCKPKCTTKAGDHNHQCNSGGDRTPAQKAGDQKRTKK